MELEVAARAPRQAEEEEEEGEVGLHALPPEVACRLLAYLSVVDLCRVGAVCRAWRALSADPLLWVGFYREMCCDVWPPDNLDALDLRGEVIEAMNIKWEWERDRAARISKAWQSYAVESRVRLSTYVRQHYGSRPTVHVVAVGDTGVGKTSLLRSWRDSGREYNSTSVHSETTQVVCIENKMVSIETWELSPALDNSAAITKLATNSCAVLLCYNIVDPQSLERLRTTARADLAHYFPHVPFVLVGCKSDLRSDEETLRQLSKDGLEPVSFEQAQRMAFNMGAMAFVECSSATGEDVRRAIELAAAYAVYRRVQSWQGCLHSTIDLIMDAVQEDVCGPHL